VAATEFIKLGELLRQFASREEILSTGYNEVPYPGGGSIWGCQISQAKPDNRDFIIGYDSSARMALELISDVLRRLGDADWLGDWTKRIDPDIVAHLLCLRVTTRR
jgi:hypothetical protein